MSTIRTTLAEIGVRKVRVTATVTFEAYVLADHEDRTFDLEHRVAHEIADAVEHRAPGLTDTEPGGALVAMTGQVRLNGAQVRIVDLGEADATQAAEAAEGYAAEVF